MERRTYERIPTNMPALYRLKGPAAYKFFESTVINMTPEGLCFISQHKVKPKMKGQIQVELSKKDKVLLEVEVRWFKPADSKNGYNVGVKVLTETKL